ncbi:SOS response-associated peptidase family protein [Planctomycetota bacterium]|nr:SOS response-associated peptidase family protein [Planctomycetota bacterium]
MCGSVFKLRGDIAYVRMQYPPEIADPWVKRLIEEYERTKDRDKHIVHPQRQVQFGSFYTRPTNKIVTLIADDDEVDAEVMKWGHAPSRYKSKQPLFNARGETLEDKATWSQPYYESRCLIPVGGFFEWVDKKPHAVQNADGSPMLMAGLWRIDDDVQWCSIVTCTPSEWFSQYHNREPVVIRDDDWMRWLFDDDPPEDLIRASEPDLLEVFACTKPSHGQPPEPVEVGGKQGELF